jgi:UDP-3-O-[3-hydroxymyristoyl] glucosamine N-acyltransferase
MALDASALEDQADGRAGGLLMAVVSVRKSEIAALLAVEWGGKDVAVTRVSRIEDATADALVFAADESSLAGALASDADVILARSGADERILVVHEPRTAFAQVYARWFDRRGMGGVDAAAVIGEGAIYGVGCEIAAHAYLGAGVRLGDACVIGPGVVILPGTTLGARVKVQAGVILGSDGFGYVRTASGYVGFPQIGTLWIGDDVEIGANTTIDRGALGETRIGRGTKIDNLVHIGHNCRIGEDAIIAAQVGIAGSTEVGDGAVLAGQVGLAEKVVIGPGVVVGAQGGVPTGKKLSGAGVVFWGTPARPIKEYLKDLAALSRMRRKD